MSETHCSQAGTTKASSALFRRMQSKTQTTRLALSPANCYTSPFMPPALEIKDLKKIYKSGTVALKGVSLTVPVGDFYALLGPNGAGKTTIIGIVTSLMNKSGGTVKVFGHDIDNDFEKAKTFIGLVGQELNFNPFEKPLDIVVNQGGYYGISRSEALPRAKQLLTNLGLCEKKPQQARALPGGMKRRPMNPRALLHEPKFLILDEPTAGVDVE